MVMGISNEAGTSSDLPLLSESDLPPVFDEDDLGCFSQPMEPPEPWAQFGAMGPDY